MRFFRRLLKKPIKKPIIETVAKAASFREPLKRRRCIVPALGWYLCRSRFLDAYGDVIFEHINAAMAERGTPVTLCRTTDRVEWPGYSVIADIGVARRGPDYRDDYMRT